MKPNRPGERPISSEAIARYFTPPLPVPAVGVPPATLAEYLDRARFPRTTRPGLSPRQQFLADAYSLKVVREYLRAGGTLTDRQQARLTELEAKRIARPALLSQLKERAGRT
jgi:hypothetical protein